MWKLEIIDLIVNIINVLIAGILGILTYGTLQEMKKSWEEAYRPFLRIKLKNISFNYCEKDKKWMFLENIGYWFAKNIKINLRISEDILKNHKKDENEVMNFIKIPGEKKYMRVKLSYKLDILDPKEKYFLKYIEESSKILINICNLMIKKKFENLEKVEGKIIELDLKDIVLFDIDVSYQDILNKNYNVKYKLKFMITEIPYFTDGGFSLENLPLKLEV